MLIFEDFQKVSFVSWLWPRVGEIPGTKKLPQEEIFTCKYENITEYDTGFVTMSGCKARVISEDLQSNVLQLRFTLC